MWQRIVEIVRTFTIFAMTKYSEIHRKLRRAGCYVFRNGNRHPIWKSPITGQLFETSYHEAEEAKPGTKNDIEKRSGVKL